MRTLTLVTALSRPPRAELERLEAADQTPRALLYEDRLGSDLLDRSALPRHLPFRSSYSPTPAQYLGQALLAYRRRRRYDVVVSWGEPLSLLFAALLKLTATRVPHVALMYWMSPVKKALLLRAVASHIDHIVTWSSVQYAFAVNQLGIAPDRISLTRHPVDQRFWRPLRGPVDQIASVGNEMRDYATLVEAMRGLPLRCHIAARAQPCANHKLTRVASAIPREMIPPNVTVDEQSYVQLRALYARSRFTVIPLYPSDTDNGVRAALESMAMGKAVICSRTKGQVDVIVDGETGILVPQGDPRALRGAIEYLWAHPEVADRMGRAGRQRVEARHTFEGFIDDVQRVVESVAGVPRLAAEPL